MRLNYLSSIVGFLLVFSINANASLGPVGIFLLGIDNGHRKEMAELSKDINALKRGRTNIYSNYCGFSEDDTLAYKLFHEGLFHTYSFDCNTMRLLVSAAATYQSDVLKDVSKHVKAEVARLTAAYPDNPEYASNKSYIRHKFARLASDGQALHWVREIVRVMASEQTDDLEGADIFRAFYCDDVSRPCLGENFPAQLETLVTHVTIAV